MLGHAAILIMRVLHVTSGNLFGGIESLLVTLAQHRSCCPKMDPHVAVSFEGRLSRELIDTGIHVHVLGAVRASRPHTVLRARRRLKHLLGQERFDAVICHAPWSQAVFGPAVREAGVPLVFWAHDSATGRHWIERWAARTPPVFAICNSRFTADSLPSLYPSSPHAVVHCPVAAATAAVSDADRRHIRCHLRTPPTAVVILQVSRLEARKGHTVLLDALQQVDDGVEWFCWIVGYPQTEAERRYQDALRGRVRTCRLAERVVFHETTENITALYAAADVYCQPNLSPEPFGISLVEAMLSELPVVTTAMGGPREFVDESCGVLLPAGDAHAVATTLRRLIAGPALRHSLGECGAARARDLFAPARQIPTLWSALSGIHGSRS